MFLFFAVVVRGLEIHAPVIVVMQRGVLVSQGEENHDSRREEIGPPVNQSSTDPVRVDQAQQVAWV